MPKPNIDMAFVMERANAEFDSFEVAGTHPVLWRTRMRNKITRNIVAEGRAENQRDSEADAVANYVQANGVESRLLNEDEKAEVRIVSLEARVGTLETLLKDLVEKVSKKSEPNEPAEAAPADPPPSDPPPSDPPRRRGRPPAVPTTV